jgi:hypothetical protein
MAVGTVLGALTRMRIIRRLTATWAIRVVAVIVVATSWHVFNRATVEAAYASPAPDQPADLS